MIKIIQGQGVYYDAIRVIDGCPRIVRCRGDEDRPEDMCEARKEQRATDDYRLKYNY